MFFIKQIGKLEFGYINVFDGSMYALDKHRFMAFWGKKKLISIEWPTLGSMKIKIEDYIYNNWPLPCHFICERHDCDGAVWCELHKFSNMKEFFEAMSRMEEYSDGWQNWNRITRNEYKMKKKEVESGERLTMAGIKCPYNIWPEFGDIKITKEQFAAIKKRNQEFTDFQF
jgi:hypothetical protein